jgi:hypothetical protein
MLSRFKNIDFSALKDKAKKPSKKLFWAWIAYQTVKGTLTTSLIWVPMIYAWLHHHS